MFDSKYGKVLTVILVIVILAIVGLLGFLAYDYIQNYVITKDTSEFVDNFQGDVTDGDEDNTQEPDTNTSDENPFDQIKDSSTTVGSSSNKSRPQYKGFGVLGTLEIPAISLKYPILERVTPKSIETAVAFLYGTGINQPGNSVIVGHNYRNGLFFSNNKKLKVGDKLYITDNDGKKLTYTIYNKFDASPEDTSFYQRDTGGKPEVTLSTCSDDSSTRLIIFASAD